jgi:hypothetical protein
MPEEKYAALLLDQSLELLKQLFEDEERNAFFISNRTLHSLFGRVQAHFVKAFPEELERVALRQLRNKLGKFREDLLREPSDYVSAGWNDKAPVVSEKKGREALDRWCEIPEFED